MFVRLLAVVGQRLFLAEIHLAFGSFKNTLDVFAVKEQNQQRDEGGKKHRRHIRHPLPAAANLRADEHRARIDERRDHRRERDVAPDQEHEREHRSIRRRWKGCTIMS